MRERSAHALFALSSAEMTYAEYHSLMVQGHQGVRSTLNAGYAAIEFLSLEDFTALSGWHVKLGTPSLAAFALLPILSIDGSPLLIFQEERLPFVSSGIREAFGVFFNVKRSGKEVSPMFPGPNRLHFELYRMIFSPVRMTPSHCQALEAGLLG